MEQFLLDFAPGRRVLSVSELNAAIRDALDAEFSNLWVSGEISGVKLAASGHYYFTLKDAEAQVRCVCFRSAARFLKFKPRDGAAVIARGRIDVYEARGPAGTPTLRRVGRAFFSAASSGLGSFVLMPADGGETQSIRLERFGRGGQ